MTAENSERRSALEEIRQEFPKIWADIPYKGLFTSLLVLWVLLFEFLGNSTFGYIDTHSLFAWTDYSYLSNTDDEHGLIIPFIVLALFWWKRKEFVGLSVGPWMPGLVLVGIALLLHVIGYLSQQTRISLAAFFFGLYALIGVTWGWRALKASFFPMCLLLFALPLGTLAEALTFPLRLVATHLTGGIAIHALGINVIHTGTLIYDPSGAFQYEVAAACGGLRSLTAVLALCTIFGFMNFKKLRNRVIMVLSAFPLAILGNVMRLMMIIIVSEAFGKDAGQYVHDNTWFSLMPYVPAIIGIVVLGHFLREDKTKRVTGDPGDGESPRVEEDLRERNRIPAVQDPVLEGK